MSANVKNYLLKIGRIALFSCALFGLFLHGQYAETADELPKKLFGMVEFPVPSGESLVKWDEIMSKVESEEHLYVSCDADPAQCQNEGLKEWRAFIAANKGKAIDELIVEVNEYANQWPYRKDSEVWGKKDYWSAPMEFMANSGDCEDYSIFKYVTLKALGLPKERMRLVIVQDVVRNIAHAVLAVYTNDDILILDSLFQTPLPHKKVLQYKPFYSVNEDQSWMHLKPISASAPIRPAAR